jgi:hypothetical protein
MMTVSKRENFTAVWEALSTYEKAAIRKLALGLHGRSAAENYPVLPLPPFCQN